MVFRKWVSRQQPSWLITLLFIFGVYLELQAPYRQAKEPRHKPSDQASSVRAPQGDSHAERKVNLAGNN